MGRAEPSPFAVLLRQHRVDAGLTQEELAERAGLSARAVSDLERGVNRRPQVHTARQLAAALGLHGERRAAFTAAARDRGGAVALLPDRDEPGEGSPLQDGQTAEIQTFLIADIRGYTWYTAEHGDEAAARLAQRFAEITGEVVRAHQGTLIELRGDEALCVFPSARNALRCALALQDAFGRALAADSSLPLSVGIGLDAGEAVPVNGGYRGGALNLAARLCSLAGPGEVLASDGVLHLAGKIEGMTYRDRGQGKLKGYADPVAVREVLVAPEPRGEEAHAVAGQAEVQPWPQELPIGGFLGSLPATPMVARDKELSQLCEVVDGVTAGAGRLVMLAGEPGAGKTRLAQEVTLHVRNRGFLVAAGRCYEPEQAVPYYPFLDAVAALWALAPAQVRANAAGRWPYLGVLLPEELPVPPASGSPGQDDQQRVFRAVTGFLEAMTQIAPIALLLDDLHWADGSSLTLLRHLASRTRSCRLLLLGSYRDVEVGRQHPLEGALGDLRRDGLVVRVAVRRLDQEGTAALVAATLGEAMVSQEFAALVHGRTEGNPYFVQQVLRVLVERGDGSPEEGGWTPETIGALAVPESIRSAVGQRVVRLSAEAQQLLDEASVLGQTFLFEDLAQMGNHPESLVEQTLEEVLGVGLVREVAGEYYAFDHALTQQVCYDELTTRRRRRLHLAAGRALEHLPDRKRAQRMAELAWHFLEGQDEKRALTYALLAGEQAQRIFAQGEAERQYRTALHLAQDLGDQSRERLALQKLGEVLKTVGRYEEALQALEGAARAYQAADDLEAEAAVISQIGFVHVTMGRSDDGVPRLEPVLERMEGRVSSRSLAALYLPMVLLYSQQGPFRASLAAAERAVELAEASQDKALVARAQILLGNALYIVSFEAARRAGETAICVAEEVGDLDTLWGALGMLAHAHESLGEPDTARGCAARALEIAERVGDPGMIATAEVDLAEASWVLGEWRQARVHATRSTEILRTVGSSYLLGVPEVLLAWLDIAEGDWELAATSLDEVIGAEHIGLQVLLWAALATRAELDLLQGRAADALARLQPLLTSAPCVEAQWTGHVATLAEAYLEVGDNERARAVLDEGLALARAMHNRWDLLAMRRVEGMLLARDGRWEEAEEAFRDALSLARHSSDPYTEARVLYEWGRMDRESGAAQQAEEHWREALTLFQRLGAKPYRERTEHLLAELERCRT